MIDPRFFVGDIYRYYYQAAPGYQLPPGAVVSADLKLRDLVLLDDAILKRKLNFNKRFSQLRDAKRAIAVSVTQVRVFVCLSVRGWVCGCAFDFDIDENEEDTRADLVPGLRLRQPF